MSQGPMFKIKSISQEHTASMGNGIAAYPVFALLENLYGLRIAYLVAAQDYQAITAVFRHLVQVIERGAIFILNTATDCRCSDAA